MLLNEKKFKKHLSKKSTIDKILSRIEGLINLEPDDDETEQGSTDKKQKNQPNLHSFYKFKETQT